MATLDADFASVLLPITNDPLGKNEESSQKQMHDASQNILKQLPSEADLHSSDIVAHETPKGPCKRADKVQTNGITPEDAHAIHINVKEVNTAQDLLPDANGQGAADRHVDIQSSSVSEDVSIPDDHDPALESHLDYPESAAELDSSATAAVAATLGSENPEAEERTAATAVSTLGSVPDVNIALPTTEDVAQDVAERDPQVEPSVTEPSVSQAMDVEHPSTPGDADEAIMAPAAISDAPESDIDQDKFSLNVPSASSDVNPPSNAILDDQGTSPTDKGVTSEDQLDLIDSHVAPKPALEHSSAAEGLPSIDGDLDVANTASAAEEKTVNTQPLPPQEPDQGLPTTVEGTLAGMSFVPNEDKTTFTAAETTKENSPLQHEDASLTQDVPANTSINGSEDEAAASSQEDSISAVEQPPSLPPPPPPPQAVQPVGTPIGDVEPHLPSELANLAEHTSALMDAPTADAVTVSESHAEAANVPFASELTGTQTDFGPASVDDVPPAFVSVAATDVSSAEVDHTNDGTADSVVDAIPPVLLGAEAEFASAGNNEATKGIVASELQNASREEGSTSSAEAIHTSVVQEPLHQDDKDVCDVAETEVAVSHANASVIGGDIQEKSSEVDEVSHTGNYLVPAQDTPDVPEVESSGQPASVFDKVITTDPVDRSKSDDFIAPQENSVATEQNERFPPSEDSALTASEDANYTPSENHDIDSAEANNKIDELVASQANADPASESGELDPPAESAPFAASLNSTPATEKHLASTTELAEIQDVEGAAHSATLDGDAPEVDDTVVSEENDVIPSANGASVTTSEDDIHAEPVVAADNDSAPSKGDEIAAAEATEPVAAQNDDIAIADDSEDSSSQRLEEPTDGGFAAPTQAATSDLNPTSDYDDVQPRAESLSEELTASDVPLAAAEHTDEPVIAESVSLYDTAGTTPPLSIEDSVTAEQAVVAEGSLLPNGEIAVESQQNDLFAVPSLEGDHPSEEVTSVGEIPSPTKAEESMIEDERSTAPQSETEPSISEQVEHDPVIHGPQDSIPAEPEEAAAINSEESATVETPELAATDDIVQQLEGDVSPSQDVAAGTKSEDSTFLEPAAKESPDEKNVSTEAHAEPGTSSEDSMVENLSGAPAPVEPRAEVTMAEENVPAEVKAEVAVLSEESPVEIKSDWPVEPAAEAAPAKISLLDNERELFTSSEEPPVVEVAKEDIVAADQSSSLEANAHAVDSSEELTVDRKPEESASLEPALEYVVPVQAEESATPPEVPVVPSQAEVAPSLQHVPEDNANIVASEDKSVVQFQTEAHPSVASTADNQDTSAQAEPDVSSSDNAKAELPAFAEPLAEDMPTKAENLSNAEVNDGNPVAQSETEAPVGGEPSFDNNATTDAQAVAQTASDGSVAEQKTDSAAEEDGPSAAITQEAQFIVTVSDDLHSAPEERPSEDVEPKSLDSVLNTDEAQEDRPKSPWTPSYSVATVGAGTSAADELTFSRSEAQELEGCAANTPDIVLAEAEQATLTAAVAELKPSPALDIDIAERPKSPWTQPYSTTTQGSPSRSPAEPQPADDIPTADAIPPANEDLTPAEAVSAEPDALQNAADIVDSIAPEPLVSDELVDNDEKPTEETLYRPEENDAGESLSEATPISEDQTNVGLKTPSPSYIDMPERPKSPWTPSYSVTSVGSPAHPKEEFLSINPSNEQPPMANAEAPGEEVTPATSEMTVSAAEPEIFDAKTVAPKVHISLAAVQPSADVAQAQDLPRISSNENLGSLSDLPERPKSPWTPSYSVTSQGSPLHSPKVLSTIVDDATPNLDIHPLAESPSPSDPAAVDEITTDLVSNELNDEDSPQQTIPAENDSLAISVEVADVEEPGRPKSPWTPSYSVSQQGAGTSSENQDGGVPMPITAETLSQLDSSEDVNGPDSRSELADLSIVTQSAGTPKSSLTDLDPDTFSVASGQTLEPPDLPAVSQEPEGHADTINAPSPLRTPLAFKQSEIPSDEDVTPSKEVTRADAFRTNTEQDESDAATLSKVPPSEAAGSTTADVNDQGSQVTHKEGASEVSSEPSSRPFVSHLEPVDENGGLGVSSPTESELSPTRTRGRFESTASSRFFPGSWFSTSPNSAKIEGRPSLDTALGEFTPSKSPTDVSGTSAPAPTPVDGLGEDDEKKAKWCTIM